MYTYGWPALYKHTVYDRIFGDFPAKNTVYTPFIYGSSQPYMYTVLAAGIIRNIRRNMYLYNGSGQPKSCRCPCLLRLIVCTCVTVCLCAMIV